jgi:hypothetical protein
VHPFRRLFTACARLLLPCLQHYQVLKHKNSKLVGVYAWGERAMCAQTMGAMLHLQKKNVAFVAMLRFDSRCGRVSGAFLPGGSRRLVRVTALGPSQST